MAETEPERDYPGADRLLKGFLDCEMQIIESLQKNANCLYRLQVRVEKGGIKSVTVMREESM